MKVFVAWSGKRSRDMASILHGYLREVSSDVSPWMSDFDIGPGDAWWHVVHEALRESSMGILCVTPENVGSPWLLYEAGALGWAGDAARRPLVPVLLDTSPEQLPHPLQAFQSIVLNRTGWRHLVVRLCEHVQDMRSEASQARHAEELWAHLEAPIQAIRDDARLHSAAFDPMEGIWVDSFGLDDGSVHAAVVRIGTDQGRVMVTGTEYSSSVDRRLDWASTAVARTGNRLQYIFRSHLHTLDDPFQGMTELIFQGGPDAGRHSERYTTYRGYFINVHRRADGIVPESGHLTGQRIPDDVMLRFSGDERGVVSWYLTKVLARGGKG